MREVAYKGKKLKVDWTREEIQDLSHYGIDAEEEIHKIMQAELNKEILRELRRLERVPTVTDRIRRLPK
jgi:hypothetical protein